MLMLNRNILDFNRITDFTQQSSQALVFIIVIADIKIQKTIIAKNIILPSTVVSSTLLRVTKQ